MTDEVLRAMDAYAFLAPAHNPPYVAAMRAFRETVPEVPAVALFETAFFDRLPDAVTTYAVPFEWRETWHVRRYGFHGASHCYASERARALCPRPGLRHLSCHLGGSSSVAAIRDGVAVNISFGMSPQAGLPQNNRAGDLDAFAVLYLMKAHGFTVDRDGGHPQPAESGLAGISGLSGDVRDLTEGRRRRTSSRPPGARRLRRSGAPLPRRVPAAARRRRRAHLLRAASANMRTGCARTSAGGWSRSGSVWPNPRRPASPGPTGRRRSGSRRTDRRSRCG